MRVADGPGSCSSSASAASFTPLSESRKVPSTAMRVLGGMRGASRRASSAAARSDALVPLSHSVMASMPGPSWRAASIRAAQRRIVRSGSRSVARKSVRAAVLSASTSNSTAASLIPGSRACNPLAAASTSPGQVKPPAAANASVDNAASRTGRAIGRNLAAGSIERF
jgi:hypothetical protein